MRLKSLHIRNFYSIEDVFIDFSKKSGIVWIDGKNKDNSNSSNGAGKSSIYEAIIWSLFGKTIRKSNEEALVNNKNKRDCEVTIVLNGNIVIKRSRRPTFLSFKVGGKDYTRESVNVTQEAIEEHLGINYKTFLTSVVFGQQNELDFVSSTIEDKRIIIRNFLNLDDVFNLREKIKKLKSELNATIKAKGTLIDDYQENKIKQEHNLSGLELQIKEIKEKYNLTQSYKLEDILELENKKDQLKLDREEWTKQIQVHKTEIARLEKMALQTNSVCDYCGSILDKLPLYTEQECIDLIEEYKKGIPEHIEYVSKLLEEEQLINIPIPSSEYNKIEQLNLLQDRYKSIEEQSKEFQTKLNKVVAERNDLNKRLEILKFWELVFSEQGLVKYVIRSILDYLNNRVAYYLSYLTSGKYSIVFDDTLQEKIIVNGVETNYHSLSGGEKKKINFAVLLSLQSILDFNSNGKFNLLLLDEVVESIDDESITGLYNLLLELSKDKLILIISHNNTLKDLLVDKPRIMLVKQNGITKLKN